MDTILLFGKMKSPRLCRGLCMQGVVEYRLPPWGKVSTKLTDEG